MTALLATLALMGGPVDPDKYGGCRTHACVERVRERMHGKTVRRWRRTVAPHNARLERMAYCESTRRWTIVNPPFYGGLQFTLPSWAAAGGSGLPSNASRLEEKYRAIRLSRLQGWGAWPRCSRV